MPQKSGRKLVEAILPRDKGGYIVSDVSLRPWPSLSGRSSQVRGSWMHEVGMTLPGRGFRVVHHSLLIVELWDICGGLR